MHKGIELVLEGTPEQLASLQERIQEARDNGLRIGEVTTGDVATSLTIVASSLVILDVFLRWINDLDVERNRKDEEPENKVTVHLPDGKRIKIDREHVDAIEEELRRIMKGSG